MDDVRRWRVPGRVNLIGEHLDHNGGATLPIAIDRSLLVKARLRTDGTVNVWSRGERASFAVDVAPGDLSDWSAYAAGVVWALRDAGVAVTGADLVLESTLPVGAGLSSSAALTCGVALALDDLAGASRSREELARIAQRAENDFVGAPTGLMDQYAVLFAEAGHAVHLDFGSDPPAAEPVPADWGDDGLVLAVIDTGVHHELAAGEYAERRRECAEIASELGLERLAAIGLDGLLSLTDETAKARARHVLTESTRVRGAVTALRRRDWTAFGAMLTSSHASLRDDFAVSCEELDVAVEAALASDALGARMTGGGFGGSAIALLPPKRVDHLRARVEAAFAARSWAAPDVFTVHSSPAAARLP
ncbi:galactokinase [Aeromicrobium flavum]|uniref:Galactokinase n=1 Tax=Aeromicrobium flavum TaxID=416568 RepID=A0A512HTH1_9ACTN|nr:galactokinase [Aeromicrobium flavum]GEO88751.1 galactokinase [Aeromicrobium flavum]